MRLQIIILAVVFLVSGAAQAAAQLPGAKDLYFGYKPRKESRQQPNPKPVTQVTRQNTSRQTTTKPARRQSSTTVAKQRVNSANKTNAVSPTPTGLPGTKITIELSRNGKLSFVSPNFQFRSGDKIRLRLKTNFEGYVTVLNLGTSGKVNLLYPVMETDGGYRDNYVTPTGDYQIPQGTGWIVFDSQKGTETVTVIMSAKPVTALYDLDRNSDYFKPERTSKDLFVQTVGANFYAVCTEEILNETIGFTLKLRHS